MYCVVGLSVEVAELMRRVRTVVGARARLAGVAGNGSGEFAFSIPGLCLNFAKQIRIFFGNSSFHY